MGNTLWSNRHDATLGRNRTKRPKTFKTSEAAHAWAKKHGISKYDVENMRPASTKYHKFRVVAQK